MMDGVPSKVNVLLWKVSNPMLISLLFFLWMEGVQSCVTFFLWKVSNPWLVFFLWKVSNPGHWHQKLQEDWIGTITNYDS